MDYKYSIHGNPHFGGFRRNLLYVPWNFFPLFVFFYPKIKKIANFSHVLVVKGMYKICVI